MNAVRRPTLAQHRAMQRLNLAPYEAQQRELEVERAARIEAQLQADALLDCIRAAGLGGCAEVEHAPSLIERTITALRAEFGHTWPAWTALYVAYVGFGAWGVVVVLRAWLS